MIEEFCEALRLVAFVESNLTKASEGERLDRADSIPASIDYLLAFEQAMLFSATLLGAGWKYDAPLPSDFQRFRSSVTFVYQLKQLNQYALQFERFRNASVDWASLSRAFQQLVEFMRREPLIATTMSFIAFGTPYATLPNSCIETAQADDVRATTTAQSKNRLPAGAGKYASARTDVSQRSHELFGKVVDSRRGVKPQ